MEQALEPGSLVTSSVIARLERSTRKDQGSKSGSGLLPVWLSFHQTMVCETFGHSPQGAEHGGEPELSYTYMSTYSISLDVGL